MTEETIFTAALEKQTPAERSAFLDGACGADASLRQRIEVLIACHERAVEFLEKPAVEQIAAGIAQAKDDSAATDAIRRAEERILATPIHARLGETQAEPEHDDEDGQSLDFLAPSERSDALGRIGHYHVLAVIGRGGMGVVLKAFDEELQRVVAIKVMASRLALTGMARKRFRREAQAAAAVRDEHVIDIHAVEEINGLPYLVMEYVSGISLQDRLDQDGPLELKEILRIGMQTAKGLAAAHAQGLIHRDIKPANILLENGVQRVKITDFGLARAVDDASLTQSGVIAGTPQYMAPEQACGEAVDHRADLFSLGSVLYAMCTGHPPFRASTVMAVLKRVCEDTPRPIREINPDIPDWLCAIIDKLHAKDPAQRFQTASEVAELLGQYLAHLQQPTLVPLPPQADRPDATAAITVRKSVLRPSVLMILTPFLLIPAVGAILLLSDALPGVLVGACVALYMSVAFTGLFLFIVLPATRRERVRTTPKPPPIEPPAKLRAKVRVFWLRHYRRVFILALCLFLLGIAVAAWLWLGPRLLSILTHSAVLEVRTASTEEFQDLKANFRGVQVLEHGQQVTWIDAGSWAYLEPGRYEFWPEGSWRGSPDQYEMVVSPPSLLLTAGQRYSVTISFHRKAAKNSTPPQVKLEQVQVPTKPFTISRCNGQPERSFATLTEAVGAAESGATIEVRGNGPFVSSPVFIRKPLTIRAAKGFRPIIELNPAQLKGSNPLLESNAPLVLEGLHLRRIGTERYRSGPLPSMVTVHEASVRAANCRFVSYPDCVALTAFGSPVCEVRNCEFLSTGIFARVDHILPHRGRLIVANNVMLGGDIGVAFHYRQADLTNAAIELTGNTLVVQTPLCLFLDTPPPPLRPGTDALAKPIRLQAAENLLDGQHQILELFQTEEFLSRRPPLDAGSAQDLVGRLIAWKEQNNVYPESISLLAHFVKVREPLPAGKSLADWNRFWGVKDTAAVRGEIRYRGGDLHSRALIELEQVTAADFHLQAGSPGKGKGVGGRDLGADVDLVGPGLAYERWKKTPEYQRWLSERK